MPIYDYLCERCETEFSREQRITDDPVKTCPSCRSRKVKRLISRTSFVLKGGGWYSDLYSSPGSKSDDGDGKADKKPDTGDGDGKGKDAAKEGGASKGADKGGDDGGGKSGGKGGGKGAKPKGKGKGAKSAA